MKEYAKTFYKSKEWQKTKNLYMSSIHYVCERCGAVATICHHKKYITPYNITNVNITLDQNNLEGLCQDCHNKEHTTKDTGLCKAVFDSNGNVIGVKDSRQIKEYKEAVQNYERKNPPTVESLQGYPKNRMPSSEYLSNGIYREGYRIRGEIG